MRKGYLSEFFAAFGWKRLSAVEASRHRSNQHEFDGVGQLRDVFGRERQTFPAVFIYLSDVSDSELRDDGFLTWYDARENHPTRSEYRLYFPDTSVSDKANEGDLLIVATQRDGSVLVLIVESGSTVENQVLWLFGVHDRAGQGGGYSVRGEAAGDQVELDYASRYVLEQLGIQSESSATDYLDVMLERFQGSFPSTRVFSAFARSTLPEVQALDDPDEALLTWMGREELLFRTLERHLIGDRLRKGFEDDVDSFIQYSLSVQNRRKARAGSALENHLEQIFVERNIRYSRAARTEGRAKPDFLFPGIDAYRAASAPADMLTMLGVKSSCKDRWRQVLAEADRIESKHLLTLEPGISENQTDEMQAKQVQLVLPQRLHATFSSRQSAWLMSLEQFVGLVSERQQSKALEGFRDIFN